MKRLLAAFLFASSPVVSLAAPAIGGLSAEESAVLRALIAKVDATAIQGSANPTLVGKTTLTYSGDQTYSMYGASRRCESGASPSPVPHRCGASPPPPRHTPPQLVSTRATRHLHRRPTNPLAQTTMATTMQRRAAARPSPRRRRRRTCAPLTSSLS